METLRPALAKRNSPLASLSEVDLLVQIFREGVSRHEDDKRGTGLKLCASSAIRFQADLDVRLARQRVQLRPGKTSYEPNLAYRSEEHTSELQSLMRISYAVFCLKKKTKT